MNDEDKVYTGVSVTPKGEAYLKYITEHWDDPDRLDIEQWCDAWDKEQAKLSQ